MSVRKKKRKRGEWKRDRVHIEGGMLGENKKMQVVGKVVVQVVSGKVG